MRLLPERTSRLPCAGESFSYRALADMTTLCVLMDGTKQHSERRRFL